MSRDVEDGAAVDTTGCRQCGDVEWISVLDSRPGRARYWCRRCGAVVRAPSATGRDAARTPGRDTRPPATPGRGARKPAAAGRDGGRAAGWSAAEERALAEVMPGAMLRWLRQRAASGPALRLLRWGSLFQLYRGWDAHLAELGDRRAARLAQAGEVAPVPGLPEFAAVAAALHDHCYHAEAVARALAADGPATRAYAAALRERVDHAHRWLATHGREQCWIVARVPKSGLATPGADLVKQARAALEAGAELEREAEAAAQAALFGTTGGPSLSTLLRSFPAARMAEALAVYLETGDRPLRDELLTRLDAAAGGAGSTDRGEGAA